MSKDVSRRDFLKGAALSALGLGLMGGSALAEGMPEGEMPAGGPPPMMAARRSCTTPAPTRASRPPASPPFW